MTEHAPTPREALLKLAENADDMTPRGVQNALDHLTPHLTIERRYGLWQTVRECTHILADLDDSPAEALYKYAGIESVCPVETQRLRDQATEDRDWALRQMTENAQVAA